jgi:hypothetical protein
MQTLDQTHTNEYHAMRSYRNVKKRLCVELERELRRGLSKSMRRTVYRKPEGVTVHESREVLYVIDAWVGDWVSFICVSSGRAGQSLLRLCVDAHWEMRKNSRELKNLRGVL